MRRSTRLSSSGTKSRYFEDDVDESEDSLAPPGKKKTPKRNAKSKHDDSSSDELQADDLRDEASGDSDSSQDEDNSDIAPPEKRGRGRPPKAQANAKKRQASSNDAETPRKRGRGRPPVKKAKPQSEDEDDLDDGDDDSDDGEGPLIERIELPKLRDTGGVEYEPENVHPNTLAFLKDLKANNQRSWLKCELAMNRLLET